MEDSRNTISVPLWVLPLERALRLSPPAQWLSFWVRVALAGVFLFVTGSLLFIVYPSSDVLELFKSVNSMVLGLSFSGYLLGGSLYAGAMDGRLMREGRVVRTVSMVIFAPIYPLLGIGSLVNWWFGVVLGLAGLCLMSLYIYLEYRRVRSEELSSL